MLRERTIVGSSSPATGSRVPAHGYPEQLRRVGEGAEPVMAVAESQCELTHSVSLTPRERVQRIVEETCMKHGIAAAILMSGAPAGHAITVARHEAIRRIAAETSMTLERIGEIFHRSPKAVFYAVGKGGTANGRAKPFLHQGRELEALRARVAEIFSHQPITGSTVALEFAAGGLRP